MAAWNLEAITNSVLERLTISKAANAFTLRINKLQICRDYTPWAPNTICEVVE